MELKIAEVGSDVYVCHQTSSFLITNTKPVPTMTFAAPDGEIVGELRWDADGITFTGKADESAKVLFDFLREMVASLNPVSIGGICNSQSKNA